MIEAENGDSCGISEQGETPHEGGGSPLAPRKASVRSGNQHRTLTGAYLKEQRYCEAQTIGLTLNNGDSKKSCLFLIGLFDASPVHTELNGCFPLLVGIGVSLFENMYVLW